MTAKQFVESLIVLAWFLSTGLLATCSLALGNCVPTNPNYSTWIVCTVIVNIACSIHWLVKKDK